MYNHGSSLSHVLATCSIWITSLLPLFTSAQHSQFRLQPYQPTSWWVPSLDEIAYTVLELEVTPGVSRSAAYIQSLLLNNHVDGVYGVYGASQLNTTQRGLVFTTPVKVGTQTFQAVVDTGSADTWLVGKGYQCTEAYTGDHVDPSVCNFGPQYQPESTFKSIPNENFYTLFTSNGESLQGTYGTESVTVAGITVPNQQIAIVNTAAYVGDGVTSGVLGLAYPSDAHAYSGNDVQNDNVGTQKIYNPIFTNMYSEGLVPPLFSIALDRSGGGQLAFGGLPNVAFTPRFASSPLQILTAGTTNTGQVYNNTAYTLYSITTDGYTYSNSSSKQWANTPNPFSQPNLPTQVQMIVDSGTTFSYIPPAAADTVNYQFKPAPFYRDPNGIYVINCNAVPPQFGVKIGMETFYINPKDMIINEGGRCVSGIAATSQGGLSVLGHSFLKNVVAVFDVGANMMRFAARENY